MRKLWILTIALITVLVGSVLAALQSESPYPDCGVHTIRADDRILSLAAEAGFNWVVEVFSWQEIEPVPGEYHWERTDWLVQACRYYGLRLAARLDHPPEWAFSQDKSGPPVDALAYARFARTVAQRYRGRVQAYIIWNEPNLAQEWGGRPPDPAAYVEPVSYTHLTLPTKA